MGNNLIGCFAFKVQFNEIVLSLKCIFPVIFPINISLDHVYEEYSNWFEGVGGEGMRADGEMTSCSSHHQSHACTDAAVGFPQCLSLEELKELDRVLPCHLNHPH